MQKLSLRLHTQMYEAKLLVNVAHTKSCGSWIPGTQVAEEEIEIELSGDIVLKLFTETSQHGNHLYYGA